MAIVFFDNNAGYPDESPMIATRSAYTCLDNTHLTTSGPGFKYLRTVGSGSGFLSFPINFASSATEIYMNFGHQVQTNSASPTEMYVFRNNSDVDVLRLRHYQNGRFLLYPGGGFNDGAQYHYNRWTNFAVKAVPNSDPLVSEAEVYQQGMKIIDWRPGMRSLYGGGNMPPTELYLNTGSNNVNHYTVNMLVYDNTGNYNNTFSLRAREGITLSPTGSASSTTSQWTPGSTSSTNWELAGLIPYSTSSWVETDSESTGVFDSYTWEALSTSLSYGAIDGLQLQVAFLQLNGPPVNAIELFITSTAGEDSYYSGWAFNGLTQPKWLKLTTEKISGSTSLWTPATIANVTAGFRVVPPSTAHEVSFTT